MAYGSSQAKGWIGAVAKGLHHSHSNAGSEPHLQSIPQQLGMRAASVSYTLAHGNARSLAHWARPGIKPASWWMPVRFVSAELQQELLPLLFLFLLSTPRFSKWHFLSLFAQISCLSTSSIYNMVYHYAEVPSDFFFFLGHICGMQKFLGLGMNPCHRSDLHYSSDDGRSLTWCTPKGTPQWFFFFF